MTSLDVLTAPHPCPKCGFEVPEGARYCSDCGWDMRKPYSASTFRWKAVPMILFSGALLMGLVEGLQFVVPLGKKPTATFSQGQPQNEQASASSDAEVKELRAVAEKSPEDIQLWKNLAAALIDRLQEEKNPNSQSVLELIDVLAHILKINPKDSDALIAMGDASFNAGVMDKAAEYYQRYLEVRPDDLGARSRYGSVLALAGRQADAERELKAVLAKDPKNFGASAYLAVAYAQAGKKDEALAMGEKAVEIAPSAEARAEIEKFLSRVRTPSAGAANEAEPQANQEGAPTMPQGAAATDQLESLSAAIKESPIAGQKFDHAELRGNDTVAVVMRDFPMAAMPSFAKAKFLSSLKQRIADRHIDKFTSLRFIDAETRSEMATLPLR